LIVDTGSERAASPTARWSRRVSESVVSEIATNGPQAAQRRLCRCARRHRPRMGTSVLSGLQQQIDLIIEMADTRLVRAK
jgi:hypothetical protein